MLKLVLPILFGAAFTVAACAAAGWLLLAALRLPLRRREAPLIAFVAGAACVSLATFALCLLHQASPAVFLAGGTGVILGAGWRAVRNPGSRTAQPVTPASAYTPPPAPQAAMPATAYTSRLAQAPRALSALASSWQGLCIVVIFIFSIIYFFNALAPEVSPDGSGYHLGNVYRYWQARGFDWHHRTMYAYLPQGMEMLFLVAFSFGGNSAAALVHWAFLMVLPLLVAALGARLGSPRAGWFAGILAFTSPVAGVTGTAAYNDVALATVLFAEFHLLQAWDEERHDKYLLLIGLLSGLAVSIKYSAGLAVPFAAAFVLWRSRPRLALPVLAGAAAAVVPWAVRNQIWAGNPAAPFLNRWFVNPYFHPGAEQLYLADLHHYQAVGPAWEIALQLAFRGGKIPGIVGPAFLLAPLALLALRRPPGRRLLFAALLFSLPACFNMDARFLIPGLPFLALAMGLALENSWGALPAVALFEALVCLPSVLSLYCEPWAWRLRSVPVAAALRREPEADFLARHLRDYRLKAAIERAAGPGDRVFSFNGRAEAYISREILVGYESAFGNLLEDALYAPVAHQPLDRLRYRFPPAKAAGVRVIAGGSSAEFWSVSELRVLSGGRELPRSPGWKVAASPNGAEAALAFDGNPATRWSAWQPTHLADRLEARFDHPEVLDEVVLECAALRDVRPRLLLLAEGGAWAPVAVVPEADRADLPDGLRLAATRVLRERDVRFLLIDDSDYTAEDMKQNMRSWGITLLAETDGTRFYRID